MNIRQTRHWSAQGLPWSAIYNIYGMPMLKEYIYICDIWGFYI